MYRLFLPFLIFLLFSCSTTPPTQEELASLDYGAPPENPTELFQVMVERNLKDPLSAQYSGITPPRRGWKKSGSDLKYGWWICGDFNAKNSFGAYTGFTPYVIRYLNGETYMETPLMFKWEESSPFCSKDAYENQKALSQGNYKLNDLPKPKDVKLKASPVVSPTASKIAYLDFKKEINKPFEKTWNQVLTYLNKSEFNISGAVKTSKFIIVGKTFTQGEKGYGKYMDCGKCVGENCRGMDDIVYLNFTIMFSEYPNMTTISFQPSATATYSYIEDSVPRAKSVACFSLGTFEKEITNYLGIRGDTRKISSFSKSDESKSKNCQIQCKKLKSQGQLKKGMSLDACMKSLCK